MSITRILVPISAGAPIALGSATFAQNASEESREQAVQMSQVPKAARDAAQKALGTAPTEAKIVSGTSPQQYELEAKGKSGQEASVRTWSVALPASSPAIWHGLLTMISWFIALARSR